MLPDRRAFRMEGRGGGERGGEGKVGASEQSTDGSHVIQGKKALSLTFGGELPSAGCQDMDCVCVCVFGNEQEVVSVIQTAMTDVAGLPTSGEGRPSDESERWRSMGREERGKVLALLVGLSASSGSSGGSSSLTLVSDEPERERPKTGVGGDGPSPPAAAAAGTCTKVTDSRLPATTPCVMVDEADRSIVGSEAAREKSGPPPKAAPNVRGASGLLGLLGSSADESPSEVRRSPRALILLLLRRTALALPVCTGAGSC